MHPSGRPQQSKGGRRAIEAFSIRRPLVSDSADALYDAMDVLLDEGKVPEEAIFQPANTMGVSYIEKGKISRQLRTWTAGFNTGVLVCGVTALETMSVPIKVGLGRVGLMGTRNQTIVARLDHSQVVAEEYAYIANGLSNANIPGMHKQNFRPHVALLRLPNEGVEVKRAVAAALQEILPLEVMLGPLVTDPPYGR